MRAVKVSWPVFLLLGLSAAAQARQDVVPGSRYTSARAAAMGDAFLPLAEDGPSALFYNPAGIGKLRAPQIEPANFSLYANSSYLGLFSLRNLGFYRVASLKSYLPTLTGSPGTMAGVGASLLPSFATPNFAAGVLMQSHVAAQVNDDGTVRYRSTYRFVPAVSIGTRLAGGIVRVGYSLQWVNQALGTIDGVARDADPLGYNEQLAQGSALSHNVGFALTLPVRYLPQVNLVARNVLGARFSGYSVVSLARNANGTPPEEPMTIDASFSLQPKMGGGSYWNIVVQDRDLTNRSGVAFMGRLAVGVEFSFRDQFFLRGGWGSGYPAVGLGLRRKGGEFSFSWYSEEVGSRLHDIRDLRYLMQYQVRAF
ncbi:MAG: hypothetical protein NDJ89_06935 [Oligoflexia bacterium]|nr:hypothetical protein [Oligoflexia bacterium]